MDIKTGLKIAASIGAIILLPRAAGAELSLGFGKDIVHAQETWGVVARLDHRRSRLGFQAMVWNGPEQRANRSVGLDFNLLGSGPIDLNIGGAWLDKVDTINGTHLNYSLGAAWNASEHLGVRFNHFSNAHNKNNSGWNFLLFMYRF